MGRTDIILPLELKVDDDEEGVINGIASVADLKDLHGEVIDPGAFTKHLSKQNKVQFLADHDTRNRIGIAEMEEQGLKLKMKGMLNMAKQLAVDTLSDVKFSIKHKLPLGLSIGFETLKDEVMDGVRHLKEIKLWEVSVVTFPANPKARVQSAKSLEGKAVVPFQDFPLADRARPFSKPKADRRVREWAGAEDGLISAAIWNKYAKCFVWWDKENPDKFSSYKLLITDIVDDKKTAIPRAIFAAAAVVQGARGGLDVPNSDLPGIKAHLTKYFDKMDLDAPFDDQDGADLPDEVKALMAAADQKWNFGLDLNGIISYCDSHKDTPEDVEQVEKAIVALKSLLDPTGTKDFSESLDVMLTELKELSHA